MTPATEAFNALLSRGFEWLLWPLQGLGATGALALVSVGCGLLMLWIFGRTSNQTAVRHARERIRGNLLGIRIFGDDPAVLLRLQGRILRLTLTYLRLALLPALVLLLPVVLILIQLDLHFSHRPLLPGETAVVKANLRRPLRQSEIVRLTVPPGVTVETPALHVPALSELAWRVRADRAGRYLLRLEGLEAVVEKELRVGESWGATPARRTGRGVLAALRHPGEPALDRRWTIAAVEVVYPRRRLRALGFELNWLVVFFVVSILSGFALRRPLGVEI